MEGMSAKGLARLFKDNVWKLYGLLESIISDRGLQFAVYLTKESKEYWVLKQNCQHCFTYKQTDKLNV